MSGDAELVQIVDAAVAEATRLAGGLLTCRSGCTHCCIGPFTVTERDLDRLRVGYALAPEARRKRIAHRSAEAREVMREEFPGDWTRGRVTRQDHGGYVRFAAPVASLPCVGFGDGRLFVARVAAGGVPIAWAGAADEWVRFAGVPP